MKKCIINGKVILHDEIVTKNVFIEGDKVVEISERKPEKEDIIDAKGLYVSPGFIDIHTHGRGGYQVMDSTFESLNAISKASLQTGVTSFLVSTVTMPIESISHAIENVVYFELLRRGYDVAIGKVGNAEIDFIAAKADEKIYVQVTESMESETVRARELAPLQGIADNYEKIVLSLHPGLETSYDGIKSIDLIEWLLENQ